VHYRCYYCDECAKGPCYSQISPAVGSWPRRCIQAVYVDDLVLAEWKELPSASISSVITSPEERDCDTCANDGECYVTQLKCRGYMRAVP
jgi:hypothetical protein